MAPRPENNLPPAAGPLSGRLSAPLSGILGGPLTGKLGPRPAPGSGVFPVASAPVQPFVPEAGAIPFPGYLLVRLRGRGGFATVWEATEPSGNLVALKFMSSANVATTSRELRSLRAVQTLDHPGLLRIRQVWSLPGWIVIGMDLAEASLLDLLELYAEEFQRPIEVEKLAQHLVAAAHALDFLNARKHKVDGRVVGLQHGDIKPNNILLLGDTAQLADYGLATPLAGASSPCPRQGTAEYCAPEVFLGTISDKSDQFSLAVTYHLLRTGAFPYPPPPPVGESLRNYARPAPDLSSLPLAERPILARALDPVPQERYPTCMEMMTRLLAANRLAETVGPDGRVEIRPSTDSVLFGRSQLFR